MFVSRLCETLIAWIPRLLRLNFNSRTRLKFKTVTVKQEVIQTSFRMSSSEQEIQTQIIEIDDCTTVMTNGVLNTSEDSQNDEPAS